MGLDTTPPQLASARAPPYQAVLDWCNLSTQAAATENLKSLEFNLVSQRQKPACGVPPAGQTALFVTMPQWRADVNARIV